MADTMRLDRFLWFARLAKTRERAQEIATEGRLRIDGRPVDRSSAAVRVGNILTFAQGTRVRVIRVEVLPPRRGPAPEAQGCYQELETATPGTNNPPPPGGGGAEGDGGEVSSQL